MLNDLLNMIEARWRPALERLVEEGEADPEFLAYLEKAPKGEAILDAALAVQAERLHAFSEAVRTLAEPQNDLGRVSTMAVRLREALEATLTAGTRERMRIFDEAFRDIHPDDLELLAVTLNGYRHSKRRKSA